MSYIKTLHMINIGTAIAAVHELHVHDVCIENMDTYILRQSRLKYG